MKIRTCYRGLLLTLRPSTFTPEGELDKLYVDLGDDEISEILDPSFLAYLRELFITNRARLIASGNPRTNGIVPLCNSISGS